MINVNEIMKLVKIANAAIEFALAYKSMVDARSSYRMARNNFLYDYPSSKSFKQIVETYDFQMATGELYESYTKSRSKMNKLKIKLINLCTVKE